MPVPAVSPLPDEPAFAEGLARIRAEFEVPPSFPPAVLEAASEEPDDPPGTERDDRRDLPLVTIDPPGSRDLDQAFAIERRGEGWTVWYAIADVGAAVAPGSVVAAEAWTRGLTLYLPGERSPLHPPALSEGWASLLPGEDRRAVLWRLDVDGDGRLTSGRARRAVVRSRAQLDYPAVQAALDAGGSAASGEEPAMLLREVGQVLQRAEAARGGVSLPLPDQEVGRDDATGRHQLAWRTPLAVEGWNAQLSLLCGRAAGNLMLQGGVGVLRTLPPLDDRAIDVLRRAAGALGVPWPGGPAATAYPAFVRSLDPSSPAGAALLTQAARSLRGAGYVAFGPGSGVDEPPSGAAARHAAVAAPYAHVTAPLRRLVDRFAAELALAVASHVDPPGWATAALAELPERMAEARQREGAVGRAVLDLAEAVVLADRVGEVLDAVVVGDGGERGADVQLLDPPVLTRVAADRSLGDELRVRVEAADVRARRVVLAPV